MAENRKQRYQLIQELDKLLVNEGVISQLKVYGSFETELDLPWSDIDIVVESGQPAGIDVLDQIKICLEKQSQQPNSWIKQISYYERAAVPIIKLTCSYKSIEVVVDITSGNDQHKGLDCV